MRKTGISFAFILLAVLLSSCSGIMGYSVLLWELPEQKISDGDIVPVYIKSNISHTYVIGAPSGKTEVPLWQLTAPQSRRKARNTAKKYAEYRRQYARVALDGLPVRAEPVNTAKQVYRLRKNEEIKLLYKGVGQPVMSGQNPLEGDWLYVLTADGTQGWCFSYNLRPYAKDGAGQPDGGEMPEEDDAQDDPLAEILSKVWYPDSYLAMIKSGKIDPKRLVPSYNLSLNSETKRLSFSMPGIHESWDYAGAVRTGDSQYTLKDIPIVLTLKKDSSLVARYTGEDGKPEDFGLAVIENDINALVQAEQNRRERAYRKIFAAGPQFRSSNYGRLVFKEDHLFTWSDNRLLVPSVIAASARSGGTVSVKYFLDKTLALSYDGVLTFQFEGMKKEVNFLYKMEETGLRLEDATGAVMNDSTFTERALSPLVLFFSRDSR